jgi:hydroxyacylglutathione hydrolase
MLLRPFLKDATSCASYLFGCTSHGTLVVDPHADDGDVVELGNTHVRALATPGHAPAHHAYLVSDLRRGTDQPWLAFTGDSLLIGDVGRPDLHVAGGAAGQARILHASLGRLLELSDGVVVLPSHYGGSVCGRGLSSNPISAIGFERAHNPMVAFPDADAFAQALVKDMPQRPSGQAQIVAANRRGVAGAPV